MLATLDCSASSETRPAAPVAALERALETLGVVVATLPLEVYRARLFPGTSGSIGEHVRHCLDHVAALVCADPSGSLS